MTLHGWTPQRVFCTTGIASVGGALLAVAGDEISQYSPQGYASVAAVERALPWWRLLTGEMLGVLGVPLCLIGYWCVCQALRWSGVKGSRVVFWLSTFCVVMGVVSHAIISSAFTVMHTGDSPRACKRSQPSTKCCLPFLAVSSSLVIWVSQLGTLSR